MKNILNFTKYILMSAVALSLTSCDEYLSPAPTAAISSETFFQTQEDFDLAVINMYDAIAGLNSTNSNDNHAIQVEFYLTEMRSDNTRTKAQEGEAAQFEFFTIESTNGIVDDYYRSFYDVIFRANSILDNLSVLENAGTYEAEAKFVRAYAYFNLVRLFGDIPLVRGVIGISDNSTQFTRIDASSVYELIQSDLNAAITGLDNSNKTRASKAAAQALLAKVYLTLGTNFLEAQTLCESVITSGFALEPNFKDVFYNELNNEIIFAIGYQPDNTLDSQNFSAEWLNAVGRTSGVNYATENAVAFLDANGGDRTPYSYRIDTGQPTKKQVVKYLPNGDSALGIDPTSSNPILAGNDWIVLRYADVLLMHVEAIMAGANETSSASALNSFQQVRNRAGLTDPVISITKQELLDERRAELAFENHRLFDLIRFGEAQSVLSDHATEIGGSYSSTDLLLPIPQREINLSNGQLSQNPGY